jgi:hypothetical protein
LIASAQHFQFQFSIQAPCPQHATVMLFSSSDCLQLTREQNSYSSTPPPAGWSGLRAWYPLASRPYDLPASLFDSAIVASASGCIRRLPRSLWPPPPPPPPPWTREFVVLVVLTLLSGERAYYDITCSRTIWSPSSVASRADGHLLLKVLIACHRRSCCCHGCRTRGRRRRRKGFDEPLDPKVRVTPIR